MSITDDVTGLDLTWAEKPEVAFTAGTLADSDALVTQVEAYLRRGTLGAATVPTKTQVETWLIQAKEEMMQVKSFTWKRRYAYATTTAGTYRYALPPDYDGGHVSIRDITNDRKIKVYPEFLFDTKYPDPSEEDNDEPLFATIKNMELWFVPPAAGTYTIELEYDRSGSDNTTTDFSYLPEIERFRCVDFATGRAFESLHNEPKADRFMALWERGLGRSIRADARRKWQSMNYQCPDAMTMHRLHGWQRRLDVD